MYSKYLDILIALMTNLALTNAKSRTVPRLASELAFLESDVRATLEAFTGIFRKSKNTDSKGEHFFTLHVRFALRATEQEDGPLPNVRPELLKVLLEFVSQRAAAEAEEQRFRQELDHTARNAKLAAGAALCAAVFAAIAVILAAILKG
jgi:hypothetical protein